MVSTLRGYPGGFTPVNAPGKIERWVALRLAQHTSRPVPHSPHLPDIPSHDSPRSVTFTPVSTSQTIHGSSPPISRPDKTRRTTLAPDATDHPCSSICPSRIEATSLLPVGSSPA